MIKRNIKYSYLQPTTIWSKFRKNKKSRGEFLKYD